MGVDSLGLDPRLPHAGGFDNLLLGLLRVMGFDGAFSKKSAPRYTCSGKKLGAQASGKVGVQMAWKGKQKEQQIFRYKP
jgi:hypothetical protein